MKPVYEPISGPDDMVRHVKRLGAQTVIVDIEPLVAYWDGPQEELDHGIAKLLPQFATAPSLRVVCFSTNSARVPSAVPGEENIRVIYVASARKPVQTARYEQLPRPGAVIGDQLLTDGLLARRLGYAFLHYQPPLGRAPVGPMLLNGVGRLVRPILFAPGRSGL